MATTAEVLAQVETRGLLTYPVVIKGDPVKKDQSKFYRFHQDHGHKTNYCRQLKIEIEKLVQKRHLRKYVQRNIDAGINLTELYFKVPCMSKQPITFTKEKARPLIHPHNDAIVVDLRIAGRIVFQILVNNGSFVDILFTSVLNRMNLVKARLEPIYTPIHDFTGNIIHT
ncbi:hypothetical protein UlMin_034869 [Ulmus minor]